MIMTPSIGGICNGRFEGIREVFEENFSHRGEIGASLAIYYKGELVVDLWGGSVPSTGSLWQRDTLVNVFSVTKGMSAVCLHMLADRGLLDIEAPVARYWPEFGCNGKETVTVAMALSHQAGVPFWQSTIPENGLFDWELATTALAAAS